MCRASKMPETVVDDILAYERSVGEQAAGSLSATVLAVIAELAPRPLLLSVETGSGKSTVLLSNLSERHICFTLDDTAWYPPAIPVAVSRSCGAASHSAPSEPILSLARRNERYRRTSSMA